MENTLRYKTISGLSWSAFSQVMQQGTGLIVSLILARLLGPSAYGLIGMVTIFTGFGSMFVELGLASGMVQRKVLEAEHASSVFWVNMIMGSMLTMIVISVAPLIARFYGEPALIPIARVSSLAFVLGALGTVQGALLSREMRFGALAKIDVISTALSGLLGISMALKGLGVWSLVAQALSATFVRTVCLWGTSQWRPRLLFSRKALREFAGFSGNLSGFNAFNYWARNADNLLIGRFIGSQALGLYSRAYQLMVLPVYQISGVAGAVMFPVLSSVQHDLARVRNIYLRSISSIHLIAAPIYAGLFVIADTFVDAFLGERWQGLVPILRILCTVGFFQPVASSTGWLYTSLGRTDRMFKWGVFTGVVYVGGFFIGLKWGLLGVTWSYCIVSWAFWYPGWSIAGKLAGLSFTQMLAPLMPSSFCAIAMGIVTWLVGVGLRPGEPTWLVLAMQVLLGAAIYGWLVLALRVKSGQDVVALIAEQLRPAKV
jgi:PST family polysaccharide transporter